MYASYDHGLVHEIIYLWIYVHCNCVKTAKQKGTVTPKELAQRWRCSLVTAKRTLEKTTQRAVCDFSDNQGMQRLKPV